MLVEVPPHWGTTSQGYGAPCVADPGRVAPGAVVEFHSYRNQDPRKHGQYDSRNAFVEHWQTARPNVVEIGRTLREYRDRNPVPSCDEVKPYLDCVFSLNNPDTRASVGAGFARAQ